MSITLSRYSSPLIVSHGAGVWRAQKADAENGEATTGPVPLVLCASIERDGVCDELARALGNMEQEGLLAAIELEPLTVLETTAWIRSMLLHPGESNTFAEFLHARTGGNPFFVVELLKSVQ